MSKSRNVLIWGGGFVNKGAEAMVRTVQSELRKRLESIHFTVECTKEEERLLQDAKETPFQRSNTPWKEPWEKLFFRWWQTRKKNSELQAIDAFIDVSGYAYYGNSTRTIYRSLAIMRQLKKWQIPIIMMPQAWGPFISCDVQKAVTELLNLATVVHVRDTQSRNFLSSLKAIPDESSILVPDIAFLFEGISKNESLAILKQYGLHSLERPLIGISPNMRIYDQTENRYVDILVEMVDQYLNQQGANVILLPHEIHFPNSNLLDDRYLCTLIQDRCKSTKGQLIAINNSHTAEEIKGVIGTLDLLIGSRFHGIVAALSQGVPVVTIGWSHKYAELMAEFGLESYVTDHQNLSAESVIERSLDAWKQRLSISKQLKSAVVVTRQECDETFDRVAQLLI